MNNGEINKPGDMGNNNREAIKRPIPVPSNNSAHPTPPNSFRPIQNGQGAPRPIAPENFQGNPTPRPIQNNQGSSKIGPAAKPLGNAIKYPQPKNPGEINTNQSPVVSQALRITGTDLMPQHNKPIYQPVIYQPYIMPVTTGAGVNSGYGMNPPYPGMMNNGYGMNPPYPGMMNNGYGMMQQPPYPQVPGAEYPWIVPYPNIPQYPAMEQYQHQEQYQEEPNIDMELNDSDEHFAVMNPDLDDKDKKRQRKNAFFNEFSDLDDELANYFSSDTRPFSKNSDLDDEDDDDFGISPFGNPNSKLKTGFKTNDDFETGDSFKNMNEFGESNVSGKLNDFGDPASFIKSSDFGGSNFESLGSFDSSDFDTPIGKINPVKAPFSVDELTTQFAGMPDLDTYDDDNTNIKADKKKLPLWVKIVIIVGVVILLLIAIVIVLYFNVEIINKTINDLLGIKLTEPFKPWF